MTGSSTSFHKRPRKRRGRSFALANHGCVLSRVAVGTDVPVFADVARATSFVEPEARLFGFLGSVSASAALRLSRRSRRTCSRDDIQGVQMVEFVQVGEQEAIGTSDLSSECGIVVDDSVLHVRHGAERAVDVVAICAELGLAVRVEESDSFLVLGPSDGPITMGSDVPGGSRGPRGEFVVPDLDNLFVIPIGGVGGREELVEVDISVGNDVVPEGIGDIGAVKRADDSVLDTGEVA